MKAILISIRPQWVEKILNGEKTIEIRKTYPKCDLPIDVYIYCTKDKDNLYRHFKGEFMLLKETRKECLWNGKVVAKFTLNTIWKYENKKPVAFKGKNKMILYQYDDLQVFGCISLEEINKYCNGNCYTWHIDNLEIFDKPKELSDFFVYSHTIDGVNEKNKPQKYDVLKRLNKAPQSFAYIRDVV